MLYKYEAITSKGLKKYGAIVTTSRRNVYTTLVKKNLQPIGIKCQYLSSRKIDVEEILLFFLHINFQLKCGAHINEAIDSFIDFKGSDTLNAALIKVSDDVRNGEKISTSFEKNCAFNPIIIGLLKAAENTGCVVETISCILNLLKLQRNWKKQVRGILAYPIFIALIAILILFVSSQILGPQVVSLIKNYGSDDVPFLTSFAVDLLPWLSKIFGIALVAVFLVISIMMVSTKGTRLLLECAYFIPGISKLIKKVVLWQLFEILHVSYIAKLDFMMALDLGLQSVLIPKMKNDLVQVKTNIINGDKIVDSFSKLSYIPTEIVMAIFIGEEGNNLERSFQHVSEKIYDELVDDIRMLGNSISIALTIFTGMIFIFILCSLFQPIYDYVGRAGA